MKKRTKRKLQNAGLCLVLLAVVVIVLVQKNSQNKSDTALREELLATDCDLSEEGENIVKFSQYIANYNTEGDVTADVYRVDASNYSKSTVDKLEKLEGPQILTDDSGDVSYEIDVKEAGLYQLRIGYYPVADSDRAILRDIRINGEVPYEEAKAIEFSRVWNDTDKDFLMNTDTNQASPTQEQMPMWTSTVVEAADGSVEGPLLFYLKNGKNTVTLAAGQSSLGLEYIEFKRSNGLISYEEYLNASGGQPVKAGEVGADGAIMVQAEDAYIKSSAVLVAQNDRTSCKTVPYHASNIVLNTIGGTSWEDNGQELTWKVDVDKSGLYKIAARYSQSTNRDFYSARELKINGEVPFEEAADIKFYYESEFQMDYFGGADGAYYFYLNEGENLISMKVTEGDLAYAIEQTSIAVSEFNDLYRKITAVTGSNPDSFRDYNITASVPDMVDTMKKEYVRLTRVMESLGDAIDNSTKTREITKMLLQLEKLIKKPDKIAVELSTFNDNITAVSEWMLSLNKQPLTMDYLIVCGDDYKLPKANGNFFENTKHNVAQFIGSFTNDYVVTANEENTNAKEIEVWMATATRDQYDIVNRMINNAFAGSDIKVKLKMVNADTVMPATLTGNGPDVAIQLNYSIPTNFAYRDAGYDLTQFSDYQEVADRFSSGAMDFMTYEGGTYGLPDMMTYPVLFYRKDILDNMGLEVPRTWEELKAILPYLQADNMGCFFETTGYITLGGASSTATIPMNNIFASLLFQNGIDLYRNDGANTNLDTTEAQLIFKEWTEYYTKYSFDQTVSVVTRFRTGEIPVMVVDYTYINSIAAAAPEIAGKWGIASIPGTEKADGTIDYSTSCMVSSSIIVKDTVETKDTADEAWEFLKWWTSEDIQAQYNEELKVLNGDEAEMPLANLEAVRDIAQQEGRGEVVDTILSQLKGTPQVPGGYITGRSIQNAFLSVINDYVDPVDTLYSQIRYIDQELTVKRQEFGLSDK